MRTNISHFPLRKVITHLSDLHKLRTRVQSRIRLDTIKGLATHGHMDTNHVAITKRTTNTRVICYAKRVIVE